VGRKQKHAVLMARHQDATEQRQAQMKQVKAPPLVVVIEAVVP